MFLHERICINRHYVCMIRCESVRSDLFSLSNKKLHGVRITTCREQDSYQVPACGCFVVESSRRSRPSGTFQDNTLAGRSRLIGNRTSNYKSNSTACITIKCIRPTLGSYFFLEI